MRRLQLLELDDRRCPATFGNAWLNPNLTLSFVPDGTTVNTSTSQLDAALANIPSAVRHQEVLRAFQTWANVTNVNIGLVADGGQPIGTIGLTQGDSRFGDIRVSAVPESPDVVALGLPYDVTAGTRAGDVMFNSTQPFRIGSTTGGFDLYSVALHEAGHVLGLDTNTDPASAMFPFADRVHTGIGDADRAAVQQLYGPRQPDRYELASGNETLATASRLDPNGPNGEKSISITADITTATDVDVYSFRPDNPNNDAFLVTLRTAGLSLIVPSIDILDRNGTVLATGMGTQIGAGDVELRLTNLKRGDPYFARVRSMNADFAIGAYRLALRSEQTSQTGTLVDPEVESNDSLQSASSMDRLPSLGGTRDHFVLNSSLSSATDVDYIRVRSTQPSGSNAGTMTITVKGTGSTGLEPTVAIYDHNFTLLQPTILVREAGEFSVQVPNIEGNRDYILAVQHASGNTASGNYTLGVDIGGPAITLTTLASGTLTVAAPAATSQLSISTSEVLHLVLSANAASTPAAVRASIFNSDHVAVATAIVNAGQTVSTNVFLTPGEYQLLVGGGSTDGSGMPNLAYQLQGLILSDPVGPQAVDPSQPIVPSIPLAPPVSPPPVSPPPASPPAASPPAASPPAASPPTVTISSPRPVTPTTPTQPNSPNILLLPPTDQPTSPTLRLRPLAPGPVHSTAFGIPDPNGSRVRSLNPDGSERLSFTPFPNFSGSLRVAEADFNNDGIADILVGTGPGAASQVLIVDGGSKSILVTVPAFEDSFRGGVLVAAGDLTGDGRPDIVITPDEGGGPRVRVLSGDGLGVVSDFFGIDDPNFRGGARATVGDLNADGIGDLVVAAGFAGGPRVASYDGSQLAQGRVVPVFGDFFVFEQLLRNGSFVAAGDINGDGYADLIAGGGPGGGPRVLILDGKSLLSNQYVTLANFFSGDTTSRGGIHVAVKDLDGDTRTDLVIGSGVGSQLTSYLGKNITTTGTPTEEMDINLGFAGGVFVG